MNIQKIDKNAFTTSTWAHGETTELFIYPEHSNYAKREFLWRVSSATVTSDTSDFTPLFGVKRWIMPFDAALQLIHEYNNKPLYSITLNPYEAHCFRGDWKTKSIGKVTDFNLMLKEEAYGLLKPIKLNPTKDLSLGALFQEAFDERLPLDQHKVTLGLFSKTADVALEHLGERIACPAGDLLFVHYQLEEVDVLKKYILKADSTDYTNLVLFAVAY